MSRITEIRKNVTESMPVLAVVGATDVVVERVRSAAADAQKVQAGVEDALNTYQVELRKGLQAAQVELGKTIEAYQVGLEPARIQAKVTEAVQQLPTQVQQAPALAVSRALEAAGQVEHSYAGLAERGKQLVERVRQQKPTQDLIAQAGVTSSLAKAAVTTARRAVGDTRAAARSAVTIGRREVGDAVPAVEEQVERSVAQTEKLVEKRTAGTRAAAKRTATTARTRADATKTAAKATVTSARKTAAKAADAAESAADKVGD
jgi:heparin binding hemagglutinin HbhA